MSATANEIDLRRCSALMFRLQARHMPQYLKRVDSTSYSEEPVCILYKRQVIRHACRLAHRISRWLNRSVQSDCCLP